VGRRCAPGCRLQACQKSDSPGNLARAPGSRDSRGGWNARRNRAGRATARFSWTNRVNDALGTGPVRGGAAGKEPRGRRRRAERKGTGDGEEDSAPDGGTCRVLEEAKQGGQRGRAPQPHGI